VAIVTGYVLAACFPRRRRLGLLLPAAGAVLFGLLVHVIDEPAAKGLASVAGPGLFGVVLPVGCLVVGDAVLGAEVRSGTLHFTWLSPVGFSTIAAGRFLAGWLVAVAAVALPCAAAAVVAGAPSEALPMGVAAGAGAAAYVAVFVMLGATARRAVVWSLAFVVLVERLLGTALSGVAQWCPSWVARSVYAGLATGAESLQRKGLPQGGSGLVRLTILTAVALALATWRLRRIRLAGPSGD
jgi:ABC-2 type transport system permease protein